ncbi:hypothetical protein LTR84_012814 [Exophiala bonariae]|uniref:Xylanolytic transcriptional activator regulatory domain-containing protein n=1 Tax=Exophiala bonariae TaxID=1690606 RepID=A0AAV9MR63_9EURO|nr:hypothetical protein LTR84_012814 [Exophiala bonariae]
MPRLRPEPASTSLQSSDQPPTLIGITDIAGSSGQPNVPKQVADEHFPDSEFSISSMKAIKRLRNEIPTNGEAVLIETFEQSPRTKTMDSSAPIISQIAIVEDAAPMQSGTTSQAPFTAALSTNLTFSLQADPYEINPRVTLNCVGKFFTFVDRQASAAIPNAMFVRWLKMCKDKSQPDKMMIYSILALGSIFADASTSRTYTSAFSTIVQEGLTLCGEEPTFQLAMTYLLSTLLSISTGEYNTAWNCCGSAIRTLFALQFNTEAGIWTRSKSGSWEAQLDTYTLIECRRSLTWAAFIIECLNGCYSTPFLTVAWSEYDLYLPGTKTPFRFGDHVDPTTLAPPEYLSDNAICGGAHGHSPSFVHLIHLATTFHEVASFTHQQKYRAASGDQKSSESFHSEIHKRLHMWRGSLHKWREQGDTRMMFFDMEILYHCINLHLNRYVHHAALNSKEVGTRVKAALSHAYDILELVQHLNSDETMRNSFLEFRLTSACIEYATTTALDTVTVAGRFDDLISTTSKIMSLIASGLELLDDLARFSHSAKRQRDMVKKRLTAMLGLITRRSSDGRKAFYFKDPLLSRYGMEQDVIYGVTKTLYFQVLGPQEKLTGVDFYELKNA